MAKIKSMSEWGKGTAAERYHESPVMNDYSKENNLQAPQDPQDKHAAGYDNDASGWVTGKGKPYPHFDSTAKRIGGGKHRDTP